MSTIRCLADPFGAKVDSSYARHRVPFLSYRCSHGWMHVNADWAILEPVESDYSPTPPGQLSHPVLLTNLANRVQPILRYDRCDSALARPDRCECGNTLAAIRAQGPDSGCVVVPGRTPNPHPIGARSLAPGRPSSRRRSGRCGVRRSVAVLCARPRRRPRASRAARSR